MTLLILGLDALDAELVEEFGGDAYRLDCHGQMESVAHMLDDRPHTGEVWPTVATGLHPSEHGVTGQSEGSWDNPLIEAASRAIEPLDLRMGIRNRMGDAIEQATGASWELETVDDPTIFDGPGRVVHNWPGVDNGELHRIWDVIQHSVDEEGDDEHMSREEYERVVRGIAAEQFGWAREMLHDDHDLALAGVHIHVLDALGHPYAADRENMRRAYEWTERRLEEVLEAAGEDDDLLVLSDHGMETEWTDGSNPSGMHSWRAYSASTCEDRPTDVHDVYDWVQRHVEAVDRGDSDLDMPEDQLRQLGYID